MQRPALATVALLFSACLAVFTVSLVTSPARADDPASVKQAEARRKKAIEEDALAMNYPAAMKDLRAAIASCDKDRCGASFKGGLFRDLGAMQMLGGAIEDGRASFAQALAYDPSLELDPAYKNPLLEGLWSDAKKRSGAPGAAAAPPSSGTPASPTPAAPEGGQPPGEEAAEPAGPQPSGEFVYTPPAEHAVHTPLAIYVECRVGSDKHAGSCDEYVYLGTDKLARVVVKYRSSAMTDFKPLELQKMGNGYGGLVPCADVTPGTLRYYVQGYNEANDPIAASGSRSKPFTLPIKAQTTVPVASLPGQPPPERCADTSPVECPPDFPGCHPAKKGGGLSCEMNSQCKSNACIGGLCIDKKEEGEECEGDDECASGSCKDDKCAGGVPTETARASGAPRLWLGVAASIDFFAMPGTDDACALNPGGTATINTVGYNCVDPNSNLSFPPSDNGATNASVANGGMVGGGLNRGNTRLMATLDYELRRHLLLGARVGYVLSTITASFPGPAFPPLHLEARLTWVFDGEAGTNRLAPIIFAGAGAGEFDAFVPSAIRFAGQTAAQSENAWITAGPAFGTVGAGVRILLSPKAAITAAFKGEGAFGGTAGFLLGVAPELGVAFGL